MTYTTRTVRRTHTGLVDVHVCDPQLRLVHVLVPFGMTSADELRTIVTAALGTRKPGRPKRGTHARP